MTNRSEHEVKGLTSIQATPEFDESPGKPRELFSDTLLGEKVMAEIDRLWVTARLARQAENEQRQAPFQQADFLDQIDDHLDAQDDESPDA